MAIEKNNFKVSRFDLEFSPNSRDTMSSDDEDFHRRVSAAVQSDEEGEDDDEFDDADSGAGSDDFDLLELGETGAEFCQVGDSTCSVPFELYDLSGLEDILSIDVWNEFLTEEERFSLTKYLPDMDQDSFIHTLKELFEGANLHFGSPVKKLFEMLKGGLCEPRVELYKKGLNFFQKRLHYHNLKKWHNSMVINFCETRDAWLNCRGYSIEEKLRVLNIMKSQKSLMNEKMEEDLRSDSSEKEESGDKLWSKRVNDRKNALKLGRNPAYAVAANLELPSAMPSVDFEVAKYGKQNPKGILKLAGSKTSSREMFPPVYQGVDMNSRLYGSATSVSRQNKVLGYDAGASLRLRDQMRIMDDDYDDVGEETIYEMAIEQNQNVARGRVMEKPGFLKLGKKHDLFRGDEATTDSFLGLPFSSKKDLHAYGRNRNAYEKLPNIQTSYKFSKKGKYPENIHHLAAGDQMKSLKGRPLQPPLKVNHFDSLDDANPSWPEKNPGQFFNVDSSFETEDWNMRNKKWKAKRDSPDLNSRSFRASSPQVNDRILLSELRAKQSKGKIRSNYLQKGGRPDNGAPKVNRMYRKSEETESDSSEQYDDNDEGSSPLMRNKSAYSSGVMERSGQDDKYTSLPKKDVLENPLGFDGVTHFSRKTGDFGELEYIPRYLSKAKQKGKMNGSSPLHDSGIRVLEDSSHVGVGKLKDETNRKRAQKVGKKHQLQTEPGQRYQMSSSKTYPSDRKQKGQVDNHDFPVYEEDDSLQTQLLEDENALVRTGKKPQQFEAYVRDRRDRSEASLIGCNNSVTKKRKAKEEMMDVDGREENDNMLSNLQLEVDDSVSLKKKGKRKVEVVTGTLDMETSEPPVAEMRMVDAEVGTKSQKKPYTPITPTVHTGFSFSIIHLLSAVRMAMITPLSEDSLEAGKSTLDQNRDNEDGMNGFVAQENADVNKLAFDEQGNGPSLTVQEIVNRVRSNPGDPCILETQEPLQDLVRGVLKIFSSKTAPLGAKGWKALVVYEKSSKSWSWIGPFSHTLDHETIEEVTSPEYWGLPHKMVVKLVDSFANWLKSGQDTLQQIGSLPAPPLSLMQCNLDEKDRFRDLRAQKSLSTISPSSEEVRDYFRKEEVLRYSIPDRAFSYTAADGKKSIVAPLRRGGGKPTSKARDHFMLRRDRPPHVTILCLVRDAAARLPGSIGTRADVCTLIRDSQYIVEDVSDAQVNQVVSGALDRLHYERDPCVQFDGERKLWVYLHRDREEEDFEDDGTSSTKKWKRPKKEPADPSDPGAVTVAFLGTGDNSGFDLGSDLNAEPPPGTSDEKRADMYKDVKQSLEDNMETNNVSELGSANQDHPMVWDALSMDPLQENKLLCQENSTNEDFDDEAFGRERPVELLNASLS